MEPALFIDFGSTYTKVTAVDLETAALLGTARAPTTVGTDITQGLRMAMARLEEDGGRRLSFRERWACSSAAGGLRLVAVGLVPDLTAEAARRAALGAGARVLRTFAYRMDRADVAELDRIDPDLLLLAGGTDGGHRETVIHNARAIAGARCLAPVVVACNRDVADEVAKVLRESGRAVTVAPNVMPALGTLSVEGARAAIRDVFFQRIVKAKGLDRAEEFVQGVIMPTPAAVLEAARVLSLGAGTEAGLGELLVVDVGGATTDIHSIGEGKPRQADVTLKGLPEPLAKRTVEGDLGMRISAPSLLDAVGVERLVAAMKGLAAGGSSLTQRAPDRVPDAAAGSVAAVSRESVPNPEEIERRIKALADDPSFLPADDVDRFLDTVVARVAVEEAVARHAGRLEEIATPSGLRRFQWGKDLRTVRAVVGTGGVIVHHPRPVDILAGSVSGPAGHHHRLAESPTGPSGEGVPLTPSEAALWVDKHYVLASAGLLAQRYPEVAVRLLKRYVRPVDDGPEGTD